MNRRENAQGALWENQSTYVEIWLEKEALLGAIYPVTAAWDVPLQAARGYCSVTFLCEAAMAIISQRNPTTLYYFGDWDPSGCDIPRAIESRIREFAPRVDLSFVRVAVNPDQISAMGLTTRPTKASDSRSKKFTGGSVKLDAIRPVEIRRLIEDCIFRHIDREALATLRGIEAQDQATLHAVALTMRN